MFTLQLIISFIAGGFFIALQTFLGERVPSRYRGLVLTLPSTMTLGFIFLAIVKSPGDVREASIFIPAALVPDYLFVLSFCFLSRYNITVSFLGGLLTWLLSALIIFYFQPENLLSSIFFYCLPTVFLAYYLISKLPQISRLKPVPLIGKHVLMRAFIGGTVIFLIVLLSKTLGNVWGALFSAFPGSFSATFLIYYLVNGKDIIPSVGKTLFFPGVFGFIVYGTSAGFFYPQIGIVWGTIVAYTTTLVFYIGYHQLKKISSRLLRPSS